MKKYTSAISLSFVFCFLLFASACGQCDGCDEVYNTESAALIASDTSIDLKDMNAALVLYVHENAVSTPGDRKCWRKDMVTCRGDQLLPGKLHLYCDRDLDLNKRFITAGTDLYSIADILDTNSGIAGSVPDIILHPSEKFSSGRYVFLLKGYTKENKKIEDAVYVNWR